MLHSSVILVKPKRLTCQSFAIYGDVIEITEQTKYFDINDGHTKRYHDLATIDVSNQKGRSLINIFRSQPLATPIILKSMERHPLSSQAFIPKGNQPYLVVVAPAGSFDESAIEVFMATAKQGVNYKAGTWHHYCLALNKVSDFIVIDRGGEGENCDTVELDTVIQVELDEIDL